MRLLPRQLAHGAPEVVVLVHDAEGLGVGVVLEDAARVAVAVDGVALDEHVRGAVGDEQAVAVVLEDAAADDDVLALLDEDGRGVGVVARRAVAAGEGASGPAQVQALDDDVRGQGVRRRVRAADLDDAALLIPVVELGAGGGALAVDDGQLALGIRHAAHGDGGRQGTVAADHPFLRIRRGPSVDEDSVPRAERLPGDGADGGIRLSGANAELGRGGDQRQCEQGKGGEERAHRRT